MGEFLFVRSYGCMDTLKMSYVRLSVRRLSHKLFVRMIQASS